jgi:cell division protein FtsI (penicillin-binding protein 3)
MRTLYHETMKNVKMDVFKPKGKVTNTLRIPPRPVIVYAMVRTTKKYPANPLALVRRRLVIVLCGLLLVMLVIAGRLVQLSLGEMGSDPYVPEAVPKRADIVDREGRLLATDLMTYSVYANPSRLKNPEETAKALCRVFSAQECALIRNQLNSKKHFVWIARYLTPKQFYAINYLGLPGIESFYEPRRIYPKARLAAHLIGYTDIDRRGLSGIERAFDKNLVDRTTPLVLSVDSRIQDLSMRALKEAIEKHKAVAGMVVVASVKTGDVLALGSYPDFDLNAVQQATEDQKLNRPVTGVYEMGSTMKSFSIATALDVGAITMTDTFPVGEPVKIGRFTIRDFKPKKGNMTATEVMIHSSNIGTAHIISHVRGEDQQRFLKNFGLLDPAKVPFDEIGKPMLPENWSEVYRTTVAFGHGLSISAMQVIQGFSALVNNGMMVPLHFEKTVGPVTGVPVIKPETSAMMRTILRAVVASGTGGKSDVPGYEVGGKTGTAEKITGRGYSRNKRIASFIAAYPMSDPQVVIYAMVDEPVPTKDTYGYATGGWVAAPVVAKIVEQASPLLGIIPKPVIEPSESLPSDINTNPVADDDAVSLSPDEQ